MLKLFFKIVFVLLLALAAFALLVAFKLIGGAA